MRNPKLMQALQAASAGIFKTAAAAVVAVGVPPDAIKRAGSDVKFGSGKPESNQVTNAGLFPKDRVASATGLTQGKKIEPALHSKPGMNK